MYKCNCGIEFEKHGSLRTHARFCKKYKKTEKNKTDVYICECGKQYHNAQSMNAHYSHCIIHRNGKEP